MKNEATPLEMKETKINNEMNSPALGLLADFIASDEIASALKGIRRGIEREMVRVSADGALSERAHPSALGAALTHPYITTDFAEAQLELVTPAHTERSETFNTLASLHHFVATHLEDDETLWAASMPPRLADDGSIAIADYGTSNKGMMKTRYREGLANRYGKRMQLISGIHYNFSLPNSFWEALHRYSNSEQPLESFISERYFHLIRNVLRHGWIIPYLFGASPAVDKSYLQAKPDALTPNPLMSWNETTDYLPWATSLRLSSLGYGNSEQADYPISYNTKDAYLTGLCHALTKPSKHYAHLSDEQQLNSAVLQLENELYGSVRPKIVNAKMRPLAAMCHYGIQYIELRSLDNNPMLPLGIDELQSQFLDLFLIYSALAPSPEMSEKEQKLIMERQELVATQGRKPGLMLPTLSGTMSLIDLAEPLLDALEEMAITIGNPHQGDDYMRAVLREKAKIADSTLTPSAQVLANMEKQNQSHTAFTYARSQQHGKGYRDDILTVDEMSKLESLATASLHKQQQLEAMPEMRFDDYVAQKSITDCDACPDTPIPRSKMQDIIKAASSMPSKLTLSKVAS
ncbi:glutamate--cysteine ligase [Thaumasiovibrio sp. DFM-14]|uniref:glutamate--cysteine ligase n=1 Tax=Thaumasiovibrio sp. DFM-14 TaxID=3384792 RepID=UPI00399FF56A